MTVVFVETKSAAQRVMCEPEPSYDAGSRRCFTTCLEVRTGCFPSVTSEHRDRIFHSLSVVVEQILYAQCLQCQKNK